MPNRHGNSVDYRYGFQGQEIDNEIKGEGNSYNFGARMLDPRLGRWFSLDQKSKEMQSNYVFAANNPIIFVDPDGKDDYYFDFHANAFFIIRNGKPHRFYKITTEWGDSENGISVGTPSSPIQIRMNSPEVRFAMSSSTALFQDMMRHSRSSQERFDLAGTYLHDKHAEEAKALASIMSLPIIAIAAVEISSSFVLQELIAEEAALFSEYGGKEAFRAAITENFKLNSGKIIASKFVIASVTQFYSKGFDYTKIDGFDITVGSVFGGIGSKYLTSQYDFTLEKGFTSNSMSKTALNLSFSILGSEAKNKFSIEFKPLKDFAPELGTVFETIGHGVIDVGKSKIKSEISKKIE